MADALVDTGVVFAVYDRRDSNHEAAVSVLVYPGGEALLPAVVLVELAYLLNGRGLAHLVPGALQEIRSSHLQIVDLMDPDYDRIVAILEKYHDSRIDFVDACIMALAERLSVETILTFDRRDFGLYQPAHCDHFRLLP
jgi:predicted nucleic acid-binding protein